MKIEGRWPVLRVGWVVLCVVGFFVAWQSAARAAEPVRHVSGFWVPVKPQEHIAPGGHYKLAGPGRPDRSGFCIRHARYCVGGRGKHEFVR